MMKRLYKVILGVKTFFNYFQFDFLCYSDAALLEMKAQALIQAKYLVCIVFKLQTHFLQFMSRYFQ